MILNIIYFCLILTNNLRRFVLKFSVGVNTFVKRQVKGSGKTFCKDLSFEEIAEHASHQLTKGSFRKGYRKGVLLVRVSKTLTKSFVCPIIKINDKTKFEAKVTKRRIDEESYIQLKALNGNPIKTDNVDLILYHHDILKETNENETSAEWELISFHAIPMGLDNLPMGPVTMMRNQLELSGGTKGNYTSYEWAKSVDFWQKYCFLK
jgi:hypothetical protein